MINKLVAASILIGCLIISVLRGLGIMPGDFILPLILLSQLMILGYVVNIAAIISKDIILRYTSKSKDVPPPIWQTWN